MRGFFLLQRHRRLFALCYRPPINYERIPQQENFYHKPNTFQQSGVAAEITYPCRWLLSSKYTRSSGRPRRSSFWCPEVRQYPSNLDACYERSCNDSRDFKQDRPRLTTARANDTKLASVAGIQRNRLNLDGLPALIFEGRLKSPAVLGDSKNIAHRAPSPMRSLISKKAK